MMQPEFLQPSWPFYNVINPSLDQLCADDCGFSANSFTSKDDSAEFFSLPNSSSGFSSEFIQFPVCTDDEVQAMMEEFSMELEQFEPVFGDEVENFCASFDNSEGSFPSELSPEMENVWSPSLSTKSSEGSMDTALTLPGDDMEIDNQLGILHLLKAYGEATEKKQRELAEVIIRCLSEKVSPAGETLERLAFNLSPDSEKQGDYLIQESSKNFEAAFKAFYQIFPYGRFAHFAANSAVLEAMPDDAEVIHIVDFDMGEGIQWPPVIEAIAGQGKTLRLTSINMEDKDFACAPWHWSFEETRKQLCDYARCFGLKLKVEEMGIEDLVREKKTMKKRGGCGEWLVFNCTVGLPHMGRNRSRKHVKDFLQVAEEILSYNRGIITSGDGDACEKLTWSSGFGSFFEGYLEHYQALLESMKSSIPIHLAEARMAMDCLFAAPYISSQGWFQKWEEIRQGYHLQAGIGLKECKVNRDMLMEAKEMVKGESKYEVTIGGQSENELILEWRGTPLVRVSAWRS
ncbi:nodulation-signaling pathway 2 protein-like [Melia azedarach]|uniref:Nodulation-signaling pathway 2 protein-like n=1 Tax=Melia azedarach TaxID=155640 RepID=A0ACC1WYS0_MELAZ|nr:nodulation-signaling pathway 2 protein-like [Melia azedarach]